MRSSVWRGHLRGICWQHVAETRVSGSGKVCVKLQCVTTPDACHESNSQQEISKPTDLSLRMSMEMISFSLRFTVDEEDEYECVTVVNSHTQDVKHIVWHPTGEVGHPLIYAPE